MNILLQALIIIQLARYSNAWRQDIWRLLNSTSQTAKKSTWNPNVLAEQHENLMCWLLAKRGWAIIVTHVWCIWILHEILSREDLNNIDGDHDDNLPEGFKIITQTIHLRWWLMRLLYSIKEHMYILKDEGNHLSGNGKRHLQVL